MNTIQFVSSGCGLHKANKPHRATHTKKDLMNFNQTSPPTPN